MREYILGPGGVYFGLADAIIVRVQDNHDEEFIYAMDCEAVDTALNLAYDVVTDVGEYIPWHDPNG